MAPATTSGAPATTSGTPAATRNAAASPYFIDYAGGFQLGLLQGDLWTNLRTVAFGLRFSAALAHREMPIRLGLDVDLFRYDSSTQYYYTGPLTTDTGIIRVTYSQQTRANILGLGLFARFQPRFGYIEPFVEASIGGRWFETIARTERYDQLLGQAASSSTDFSEAISTFGVGGGVEIRLTNLKSDDRGVLHLHLGCRYIWGSEASYPKPMGPGGYVTVRSATDMIVPFVAFTLRFGSRSPDAK
ncbi:MAG: hypothetical protein ABW133_03110 [Polyangiaceae bacterium]